MTEDEYIKQFVREDNRLGLPNKRKAPKLFYCNNSNLCKPRCKTCFWYKRSKRAWSKTKNTQITIQKSHCSYPTNLHGNRDKNKITSNSPACSFWNITYYSILKYRYVRKQIKASKNE